MIFYSTTNIQDRSLLPIGDCRYFKIFAWADKIEFELNCKIEIRNFGQSAIKNNSPALTQISTDSALSNIPDQLEFNADIEAISQIAAYNKVEPPLAIGLFGNWGTGKSFFINKMQEKIKQYSSFKNDIYCHDIVQIKFNSWHYSDSNLWASLITKILNELDRYGKSKDYSLKELYENLNTTKELIQQSEVQLNRIISEKEKLEKEKIETEKEIGKKAEELAGLKNVDIGKELWNNALIQKNVKEIKEMLPAKTLNDIDTIKEKTAEFGFYINRVIECFKIMYKFRKGKAIWLIVVPIIAFVVTYLITDFFRSGSILAINKVAIYISIAAAIVTHFSQRLIPSYVIVDLVYEKLKSLQRTYETLEKAAIIENSKILESIYNELEAKREQERIQEKKIGELQEKQNALENEIEDIVSGRSLKTFIESRVSDERYINSLGIISWIRKDFEELDFLLKVQHEATDEIVREMGKQKNKKIFKIDRIILYIDDLDRCNEDIVVRVLEAIHLLLAFPLFIVVVGVDQRWIHKALNLKYKKFFKTKVSGKGEIANIDEENVTNKTTSFDYLEKIFQIPFALNPINNIGKNNLIKHQLAIKIEASIITEDISKAKAEHPISTNFGDVNTKSKTSVDSPLLPSLIIDESEIFFMQEISFLIGDSPRTVNRYINIYRIIRTHSKFVFTEDRKLEYFCAAMIMLGIITGLPNTAKKIFDAILFEQNEDSTFKSFISQKHKKTLNFGNDMEPDPDYKLLSKTLEIKIDDLEFGEVEINKFKANIDLISRFSFRNLI